MQITNNRRTEEPAGTFNFSTSLFPLYGAEPPGRELRVNSRSKVKEKQSARLTPRSHLIRLCDINLESNDSERRRLHLPELATSW